MKIFLILVLININTAIAKVSSDVTFGITLSPFVSATKILELSVVGVGKMIASTTNLVLSRSLADKESLRDELYELRKQIDSGDVVNVEDVSLPNLRELFWEISLDDEKKEEINQFIHSGSEIQKLYIATFLILYS
jgi:hypothetical protein